METRTFPDGVVPDQVRDQALSARRRISAGFGPPKDLVALCSEAIVTSLPDPVLHRRRSVRIGIRLRHSAPLSHQCGRPKAVPTRCSLGDDPRKRHLAGRVASRA